MTHQENYNLSTSIIEELARNGLEVIPKLVRVIFNSIIQAERSQYLQGHANGYKSKTVRTKLGDMTFAIPQVREGGFHPSALEKGSRSERALLIALAEMYV